MDATKSADKLFMHKDTKRASRRIKAHLRKHLGVENLKAHSFRHGCAVWLLTNGVDVYDVMKWLGHNRISTTEKYVDLAPVDLARRVYDKMNQTPKLNPKSKRRKATG
jgi:site-specific recombinase XerD